MMERVRGVNIVSDLLAPHPLFVRKITLPPAQLEMDRCPWLAAARDLVFINSVIFWNISYARFDVEADSVTTHFQSITELNID